MKQTLTLLTIGILLISCNLAEVGNSQSSRDEIWKNPTFGRDTTSKEKVRCFVTGLEYSATAFPS